MCHLSALVLSDAYKKLTLEDMDKARPIFSVINVLQFTIIGSMSVIIASVAKHNCSVVSFIYHNPFLYEQGILIVIIADVVCVA